MPDGAHKSPSFSADNLIYSLAFHPDGRRLAFAGGDSQKIEVRDVRVPGSPSLRLSGQGRSVWRVGFGVDNTTVGFSHAQDADGENVEWIGLNLATQALVPVVAADLHRLSSTWQGWRAEAIDPYRLRITTPDGKVVPIALDAQRDGRWWSFGFVPPAEGHRRLCLAIASGAGIAIDRAEDGVRTRTLSGHTSAVYALAPSPDGRFLASGSSDQTVRIWSLAGCDTLPSLGATFAPGADGLTRVGNVVARGFADNMGLKAGDVVEVLAIDGRKRDGLQGLDSLDALPPGTGIEFQVRRGAAPIQMGTTRRDSPRMSLFVGEDREWVVWTPEGYYETSVAGDRKYLGWHRNGASANVPTDRFPADRFEREFRKPAVLSALMATDDPVRAFAVLANPNEDPAAIVQAQAPPTVILSAATPAVDRVIPAPAAGLTIRAQVAAEGRSPIASLQLLVDGRPSGAPIVYDPPRDAADERIAVPPAHGEAEGGAAGD